MLLKLLNEFFYVKFTDFKERRSWACILSNIFQTVFVKHLIWFNTTYFTLMSCIVTIINIW